MARLFESQHLDVFIMIPYRWSFEKVRKRIERAVKLALGEGTMVGRLDAKTPAGDLAAKLKRMIAGAKLCIADVTGSNPNVIWEVGYAMAVGRPVLLLTRGSPEKLPFDIGGYECISYRRWSRNDDFLERVSKGIRDTVAHAAQFEKHNLDPAYMVPLAHSMGSPVYFLASNYVEAAERDGTRVNHVLTHVNATAELVFDVQYASVIGESIDDVQEKLGPRLLDAEAVQKRRCELDQLIVSKCKTQDYWELPLLDREELTFQHDKYGELRLLKLAIPVRDGPRKPFRGWVVTYNVTGVSEEHSVEFYDAVAEAAKRGNPWVGGDQQ